MSFFDGKQPAPNDKVYTDVELVERMLVEQTNALGIVRLTNTLLRKKMKGLKKKDAPNMASVLRTNERAAALLEEDVRDLKEMREELLNPPKETKATETEKAPEADTVQESDEGAT